MRGLLGKKIGMTRIFDEDGSSVAATVIEAVPSTVVQVKTVDRNGYNAVQLGYIQQDEKHINKPLKGHFKKSKVSCFKVLREFRDFEGKVKEGDQIGLDIFQEGERVRITGLTKGKGFIGVVKRYNFGGGPRSHGQSDRHRAPGSIGQSASPKRVFKGIKMAGRAGKKRKTILNLKIMKIIPDQNLLLVKGGVPGARNSLLEIYR